MEPMEQDRQDDRRQTEPPEGERTPPTSAETSAALPQHEGVARLLAVGVGGGGTNAVSHMVNAGVQGVEFVAMNTDAQALAVSRATVRVRLGEKLTRGLGAGGDPLVGRRAAEESYPAIKQALAGADMVFITAGLGGGTGTGGAPLVAQAAREQGALAVAVVTTPFAFERRRKQTAQQGIAPLRDVVDALIVVPNERLMQLASREISAFEAFRMADDVLRQGIQGISDLITTPGLINLDFADIKAVMADAGSALMSVGQASGDNRAEVAARAAITNPLLEVDISGARGVVFNITGGDDLTMQEVNRIADIISGAAHADANVIFGTVYDPDGAGCLKVTVVATGFAPRVTHGPSPRASWLTAPAPQPQPAVPAPPPAAAPTPAQSVSKASAPTPPAAPATDTAAPQPRPAPSVTSNPLPVAPLPTRAAEPETGVVVRGPAPANGSNGNARSDEAAHPPRPDAVRASEPVDGDDVGVRVRHDGQPRPPMRGYHGDEFVANDEDADLESPRPPRRRWDQLFSRR
jgi:cell division protein FtsZ